MTKENDSKHPITFDSESAVYEEVQVLAQQVAEEIPDDSPYYSLKVAFNKELNVYQMAYQKNQLLLERCDQLSATIVQTASKISSILRAAKDDDEKLKKFKQEHEEVYGVITSLHTRELESKKIISQLRSTLNDLATHVNKGDLFSNGEGESAVQTQNDVDKLKEEIEDGNKTMEEIKGQINDIQSKKKKIQTAIDALQENNDKLEADLSEVTSKLDVLTDEIDSLRQNCLEIKDSNKKAMHSRQSNKETIAKSNDKIAKLRNNKAELVKVQLDEVKTMRDKRQTLMKKGKRHTELISSNGQAKIDITKMLQQIEQEDKDIKNLKADLTTKAQAAGYTKQEHDAIVEYREELVKERFSVRKRNTERKKEMLNLQQKHVRAENETRRLVRNIEAAHHDKEVLRNHIGEQKTINDVLVGQQKQLLNEKMIEKKDAQTTKIKIRNFEKEIDAKTDQMQRIMAQKLLADDENQAILNKVKDDEDLIKEVTKKKKIQDGIVKLKKKEKDETKKRLQNMTNENARIQMEKANLEISLNKQFIKNRNLEKTIASTHFHHVALNNEIALLIQGNDETQKMIVEATRATELIKSQMQLLNHVYEEYLHKRSLEEKKMAGIKSTSEVMKHQIIERDQQIDQIHHDIKNINNQIEKGYTLYKAKQEEIQKLEGELEKAIAKTMALEQNRKYVQMLESDFRRYSNDYAFELQKTSNMVNEIGIPRNVHRWKLYETVNPTYAQHLKYHMILTGNLDKAHKEYLQLCKEKEDLKKQLENQSKRVMPNGKKQKSAFGMNLENCRKAIAEKDAEMKSIQEEIVKTREEIEEYQNMIDGIRGKVTQRKNTAILLHNRNYNSRTIIRERAKTSMGERSKLPAVERTGNAFFITQNPSDLQFANPQVGGGFVVRQKTAKRDEDDYNDTMFGVINSTTPIKTAASAIYRPSTARKRPKTALRP